ncbi:unnamed protein product, partial [Discosporangium mesarthrocarpum]
GGVVVVFEEEEKAVYAAGFERSGEGTVGGRGWGGEEEQEEEEACDKPVHKELEGSKKDVNNERPNPNCSPSLNSNPGSNPSNSHREKGHSVSAHIDERAGEEEK